MRATPGAGRTVAALGILVALLVFSTIAAAAPAAVTGAAVARASQITRVALDLSDQVAFNVFTLADPYRVVIDLPDVEWQVRALADAIDGPCGTVRYGEVRPGTWRVVLECAAPATIQDAQLFRPRGGAGYRLVVELAPGARNGVLGYMASEAHRSAAPAPVPPAVPATTIALAPSTAPSTAPAAPAAAPRSLIGESSRSAGPAAVSPTAAAPAPVPSPPPPASPPQTTAIGTAALNLPVPPRRPGPSRAPRIVVLDAGHGGADPGAIGVSGIYEKHITLAAVREIKRELERTGRYKVFLTRNDDRIIPLRDRVEFARRVNAELFVSIHADSVSRRAVRGASVYTLSNTASDSEAAALAEKENKADLIAGLDLSRESAEVTNILIDLAQRETMNQSAAFAGHLVRQLSAATTLLPNPHRFAGFAVLKAPDIPSVLIELGFLSNRNDERLLRQGKNRAAVAAAVAKAIDGYLTVTLSASAG